MTVERKTSFVMQTKADQDEARSTIAEIKSLIAGFQNVLDAMEEKAGVVRHVRTQEGVRRYNLPIGSVITGSGKNQRQLTHIWSTATVSEDGYTLYNGASNSKYKNGSKNKKATYWVGRDGGKGKWQVYDEDVNLIHEGDDEHDVLTWLDKREEGRAVGRTSRGNKPKVSLRGTSKRPVRGEREPQPGYHRATGQELIDYGLDRVDLVDIMILDDIKPGDAYIGKGWDRFDNAQINPFAQKAGRIKKAQAKAKTVDSMRKLMPAFEKKMKADVTKGSDTAKAVMLMRTLGIRVGGESGSGSRGVTTLTAGDVSFEGNNVFFTFKAKNGDLDIGSSDPYIVKMIRAQIADKDPGDPLFDTDKEQTAFYIRSHFGEDLEYPNHKMRTFRATEGARAMIYDILADRGKPKDEKQFNADVQEVIAYVADEILFDDKAQVLQSYVSPTVLSELGGDPKWMKPIMEKWEKGQGR